VPPVAGWHDTGVPAGILPSDVQHLLEGCDRSAPRGIRDFAILMLVAVSVSAQPRVARLELDDIDWRAGEIVVRGKARRRDRLPLPNEVARRSATTCARPDRRRRSAKCSLHARPQDALSDLIWSAMSRRELVSEPVFARVGAHRLRHGLATEMLRRGATLVEVSQVLRQQGPGNNSRLCQPSGIASDGRESAGRLLMTLTE